MNPVRPYYLIYNVLYNIIRSNGVKRAALIFYALALTLVLGCGYTTGSLLPSHLKTIYVDNFANKIDISREPSDKYGYEMYRSGMESDITKAVINKFIFDGNLSIVRSEEADLILTGELINYTKEPLRYDTSDNVEEYRVLVSVNMELKDTTTGKSMWKENGFTGESTYWITGPVAKSENSAVQAAIDDLADRIVEKTTEGW